MIEDVRKFLEAFGQTTDRDNAEQGLLYHRLINEEYSEFIKSRGPDPHDINDVETLDAICDLIWVSIGYALSRGWNIEEAFKEVARSNMSKLGPDGKPIKRNDGKILKPDTWSPPDLEKFL